MKRLFFIALFLTLVSALQVQAQAQQQTLPPLINVSGIGEVRVQPDQVVLSMGIEIRGATLENARKEVDASASSIIAYLKKEGVDAKDIQTSYVTVRPIFEGNSFGKTRPDFYMAQKTMTVLIKKLDKFDELSTGLYAAGANRIDGISFQTSALEKHKAEAQKRAVQNAKQKAESLTSQLDSKLGKVYSIQEITGSDRPRPYQAKMMQQEMVVMDGGEGPTIAGGEMVITSRVDVSFIIH